MTKIIYEEPRKARVIDAGGVDKTTFKQWDIIDIYAECTDEDGDKFYYLSKEDCENTIGWYYERFELLEEESPPVMAKETPKKLTPCEKLGYKVGDKFVMTESESVEGFKLGDEVVLIEDDGTQSPKFFSKSVNDDLYVRLDNVQKVDKESAKDESVKAISIKEFLESMPKSSDAGVFSAVGKTSVYIYGNEFICTTEERLQEVMAALIVLYKEEV